MKLILVGVLGYLLFPLLVSFVIYPAFAFFGRLDLWTPRNLDPLLTTIDPYLVTLLLIFCIFKNLRARVFNRNLENEIKGALQRGVEAYLFRYRS